MNRVYLIYALSGFVSLGYQVAWFRIFVDRFGSTNLTFALVVCCFIGGLGVGALLSKRLCHRLAEALNISDRLRLYGLLELFVTTTVMLTIVTQYVPAGLLGDFPYHLSSGMYKPNLDYQIAQLVLAILCVFLPCAFMGATFPLLCDIFHGVEGVERFPSALYAFNTLGACAGVLTCLFVLLPWLGHERMYWLLAGLNLALGVFFLVRGGAPDATGSTTHEMQSSAAETSGAGGPAPTALLLTCAALSGVLAGALEGDMFKRIDFLSSGNSALMALISFWAILAIFLASWTVRVLPAMRFSWIKVAWTVAFLGYLGTWVYRGAIEKGFAVLERASGQAAGGEQQIAAAAYHGGLLDSLGHSILYVGVWVFPAYFCVSLLLPYVCNRIHAQRKHLGLAYGLNTLAFCAGLVGFTLVAPRVSIFYSLKLIMAFFAIAVILLVVIFEARRPSLFKPVAAAVVIFAAACLLIPRGFDRRYMPPAGVAARFPVRALKSNGAHTTYVVAAPEGDYLFFDGHPMSGTGMPQTSYMRLMAHFPLLAQADPKRALLIGYGVGNTASAIARHDSIEVIDVIELNEKVIETAPEFADVTNAVHEDPRIRFIVEDGRKFLKLTNQSYDLITSEPPPPMQAGVYRLYTHEYYQEVLARLNPQGMMTQWIPTYQMPAEAIELAIRTFIDVFPHTLIFTGGAREFIITGSRAPINLKNIEARFYEQPAVVTDLRRMGTTKPLSLIARVVQGDGALRRRFGAGRVIRDVHNDLEFLFHDPARSEVMSYDPFEVLAVAQAQHLTCTNELSDVLTHLGRLRYHVPRYPIPTLLTARDVAGPEVRLADVDWVQVARLLQQANRLRLEGRIEAAIAAARQALDLAPEQPGALLLLASLELRFGRTRAAAETLRRLQQIEPNEEASYRLLGMILARQGLHEKALAAMRRAVELDPYSPETHLALGGALIENGSLNEAIRHLRRALALAPDRTDIKRMLGIALVRQASRGSATEQEEQ